MKKRLIMLSGPPRSGKDTFFQIAHNIDPKKFIRFSFADELKKRTCAALGITIPYEHFEHVKDIPNPLFFGSTPRQAYIDFSEKFMKPLAGKDIWAKILYGKMRDRNISENEIAIITDLGFPYEGDFMVNNSLFFKEQTSAIALHRAGCDFSSDSRGYVLVGGVNNHIMISDEDFEKKVLAFLQEQCY